MRARASNGIIPAWSAAVIRQTGSTSCFGLRHPDRDVKNQYFILADGVETSDLPGGFTATSGERANNQCLSACFPLYNPPD